ncbi:MAG TPA: hypothetical protein VML54_16600 [Candidatus Limnocylindrales bacterium]|nr:hypothetical protein [Candidatus Limnocylindrales bacterium]
MDLPLSHRRLPAGACRLFPHHPKPPDPGRYADFVIERLLDEGDREDLSWLVGRFGEQRLADWLRDGGARRLSRRSRALWTLVLGVKGPQPAGVELWPL